MPERCKFTAALIVLLVVAACQSPPEPPPSPPPADTPETAVHIVKEIDWYFGQYGWPAAVCYDLHSDGRYVYIGDAAYDDKRRATAGVFVSVGLLKAPNGGGIYEVTDLGRKYMRGFTICFGNVSALKVTALDPPWYSDLLREYERTAHYSFVVSDMPDFTQSASFRDALHPPLNGLHEDKITVTWYGQEWGFFEFHSIET